MLFALDPFRELPLRSSSWPRPELVLGWVFVCFLDDLDAFSGGVGWSFRFFFR